MPAPFTEVGKGTEDAEPLLLTQVRNGGDGE
jgi:hypothetical protein